MRWRRAAAIEPRSRAGARRVTTDATAWSCVANQRGPIDALTVSAHTLRSRRYRLDDEQVVGSSSGGPVMRGGRESSPRFVLWWRCSLLREWGSASVARRTLPGARWQVRQGHSTGAKISRLWSTRGTTCYSRCWRVRRVDSPRSPLPSNDGATRAGWCGVGSPAFVCGGAGTHPGM